MIGVDPGVQHHDHGARAVEAIAASHGGIDQRVRLLQVGLAQLALPDGIDEPAVEQRIELLGIDEERRQPGAPVLGERADSLAGHRPGQSLAALRPALGEVSFIGPVDGEPREHRHGAEAGGTLFQRVVIRGDALPSCELVRREGAAGDRETGDDRGHPRAQN